MKTVSSLFHVARARELREHELLLSSVIGSDRTWIVAHPDASVSWWHAIRYRRLANKLARGVPLAYLLGEQWFYGRSFVVSRRTLIPRPETELLIDIARENIARLDYDGGKARRDHHSCTIVDVGVGSGCIAVTLAAELPYVRVIATDISRAALRIARQNSQRHGVANRVTLLHGNLLDPLQNAMEPFARKVPWIIIVNLPYLSTEEWKGLPHSVKDYEPRSALDGGPDGLTHFRKLFAQLAKCSTCSVPLTTFLEIDPRRKPALEQLITEHLPSWEACWHRDLAGHWRVLELTNNERW